MKGSTILALLTYVCLVDSSTIHVQKRYTREDVCTNTTPTLKEVGMCPNDKEKLLQISQEKKCHELPPCQGEPLVFHCIRYKNHFAEVCAPKESITGHCCAEFDEGLGRIREDFLSKCNGCPFQYNSTETYLYCQGGGCKESKRSNRSERSVDHDEIKCLDSGNENESNTFPVYAPVIAVIALLVIFTGISLLYKYDKCLFFKKTTGSKPQNGKDDGNVLKKESSSKLLKKKNQRSPSISEMHFI